ncbi:probable serine/threonine-protein kinase DDB_G0278901 [Portunus trituberculatus]|uniref:probable serine/threonine-protein kinase DDB_G0278901 n=1 Tax=Portunus trituberculatus TaxID=210409 RepID=UPI001E1D126E|nr:probable serine/threonine-protein kinase DDB_G0278901 [Portunus trituberculatus]
MADVTLKISVLSDIPLLCPPAVSCWLGGVVARLLRAWEPLWEVTFHLTRIANQKQASISLTNHVSSSQPASQPANLRADSYETRRKENKTELSFRRRCSCNNNNNNSNSNSSSSSNNSSSKVRKI